MALREDFESAGNWLFRWRSYLPLLVVGIFLLALKDYDYLGQNKTWDHYWEIGCLIVGFFGLLIRILTIGYTPKGTSGRNTKKQVAESLNTKGIYSVVRNPLYLGNYFMGLGIALVGHLWWLALIFTLLFWLYYERIIFAEEAFLRNKFGDVYMDWADKTPIFIPKLSQYEASNVEFSLRNVLKREHDGFFALISTFLIMETFAKYSMKSAFVFYDWWMGLLGVGFVVWLVLRLLKKHTSLLKVKGR
jgi:protein-S-isoprenylcysteine O-methyltransferase Ste14